MGTILRKQFGGPDVLEIRKIPDPQPKAGRLGLRVLAGLVIGPRFSNPAAH
jgi:hypothetical protein